MSENFLFKEIASGLTKHNQWLEYDDLALRDYATMINIEVENLLFEPREKLVTIAVLAIAAIERIEKGDI